MVAGKSSVENGKRSLPDPCDSAADTPPRPFLFPADILRTSTQASDRTPASKCLSLGREDAVIVAAMVTPVFPLPQAENLNGRLHGL